MEKAAGNCSGCLEIIESPSYFFTAMRSQDIHTQDIHTRRYYTHTYTYYTHTHTDAHKDSVVSSCILITLTTPYTNSN